MFATHPSHWLATMFGIGRLPVAPGTWAALAALPLGWMIVWAGGWWGLAGGILAVFLAGIWASDRYARAVGIADPSSVVIDEIAGQWIGLLGAPLHPAAYILGFVLFRAFDIAKPWPVGWIDRRVAGGLGIMADDAVAGLFALATMQLALLLWRSSGF